MQIVRSTSGRSSGTADVLVPLIRTVATLGFAVAPCSLGFVIIAVSEQLIRAIVVGDDPEMLLSDLQNEFPHAALEVTDAADAALLATVVDSIESPRQGLELPLALCGTKFQRRVWDELEKVPSGAAVCHAALARQIGMPHEDRAVAQACAVSALAAANRRHMA